MTAVALHDPPLVTGIRLSGEEFLRRWEALPDLKRAELIDGVVYVASPVSYEHSLFESMISFWLGCYAAHCPDCQTCSNGTWEMANSLPQPDVTLFRASGPGFLSANGEFPRGAPELAVEVCLTSTDYDFGPKKALYQRAGVIEYITAETLTETVTWRVLMDGSYQALQPGSDGILRSTVFPGLWLDAQALWRLDRAGLRACVERGLASLGSQQ